MAAEISKPDFSYQWASGGAIVAPSDVKVQTGWTAEVPPFQWENYLQNRQDNAILHLFQKGISEWDALSNYYFTTSGTRSYVQGSNGLIYVALQDSVGQNPVSDLTQVYWKPAFIDTNSFAGSGPIVGEFLGIKTNVTAASATTSFTIESAVTGSAINSFPYKLTGLTKNINLAIVGVGGMDVGLAPVSGFVSIYLIYNPITQTSNLLACNQTTSSGSVYTGANMPTGYTTSCLISTWPTNPSRLLVVGTQVERKINFGLTLLNSSVVNQTDTLINLSSFVPLNAKFISGIFQVGSSVQSNCRMSLSGSPGSIGMQSVGGVVIAAGNHQASYSNIAMITPSTVYYTASTDTGALGSSAWLTSYQI